MGMVYNIQQHAAHKWTAGACSTVTSKAFLASVKAIITAFTILKANIYNIAHSFPVLWWGRGGGRRKAKRRKKEEMTDAQRWLLGSFLWDFMVCHDGPDCPITSAYEHTHCFQRDKIPQHTTFSRVCDWPTMTLRSWTYSYRATPYDTYLEFFLLQKHVLKQQE